MVNHPGGMPEKGAVMELLPDASAPLEGLNDVAEAASSLLEDLNAGEAVASLADDLGTPQPVSELGEFAHTLWEKLTSGRVVSSVILLVICLLINRLILALVKKVVGRAKIDRRVGRYVIRGVRVLLYLLTILIVAGSLGIDVTSLIALVSVFGLAVSLAVQDTLSNIAGGLVLLFAKPFSLGDYVETDDGEGTVDEMGLTHTKLDTYAGQRLMLPNSKLSAGRIVNYSTLGKRRADHRIGVSYNCDPDKVKAACLKAIARTPNVLEDPAPQAVMTAYQESSIEYHVRFWARTDDFWDANFQSLEEIYRVFAQEGIEITYNHLNVHVVDKKTGKK